MSGLIRSPAAGSSLFGESLRLTVAASILFLVAVAATFFFCRSMSGDMPMSSAGTMSMIWMRMPGWSWSASAAWFLLMWLAMMVAMMLPSALPMLSRFHPARAAALAACGYFVVWLGAGLLVYGAGVAWSLAAMRWSTVSRAAPTLTGAMLVLAGAAQLSGWKSAGLARCRERGRCGGPEGGGGVSTGLREGIRQGLYCVACSAGPMLVLLAVGLMNPLAMTVVAVLISLEKLVANPRPVTVASGFLILLAGTTLILRALV